jgi:molecular chaperone DnaJ
MQRNLYWILGVPPSASTEAIRAAFRERAKRLHPDCAGTGAVPEFRRVAEAYEVLSDPRRRAEYNRTLGAGAEASRSPAAAWEGPPLAEPVSVGRALGGAPESLAEELDDWTARYASGVGVAKSGRRRPLIVEVLLSPWEAARGGELPVHLPTVVRCEECRGTGALWLFTCTGCGGGGAVRGEAVVRVPVPGGVSGSLAYDVAVDRLGLDLRVLLRVERWP